MSNVMNITPTEFNNVREKIKSYGVRIWDSYEQTYDNSWGSIPKNDMEVLKKVVESADKTTEEMLDDVKSNHKGISIGGNYYDWDEIKEHLGVEDDEEQTRRDEKNGLYGSKWDVAN